MLPVCSYTHSSVSFVVILLTYVEFLIIAPVYSVTVLTKYLHDVAAFSILEYLHRSVRQSNINAILINTPLISKYFRSLNVSRLYFV